MDLPASDTAYRVLARKYRPQNFSDLIGQAPMVQTLTNAFDMGRIAQAWMLTGVRGVGKTTTARILARALNYKTDTVDKPTVRLEQQGEHCQAIMEGRHIDVVEMDAASHTGIDDIREIIEQVRYRPVSARYKVYIIDEVHMLSTQAFNGLLKTLEEPPPHVKFIFATTEIRKVPVTILSRCQRFDLRRVDSAVLAQYLQKITAAEGMEAETGALAMIARAGDGSVRDCLSILDQAIAHSGSAPAMPDMPARTENAEKAPALIKAETVRTMLGLADKAQIIDLFRLLMRGKIAEALALLQQLYSYGAEPNSIIRELMDFNHLITRTRFIPAQADDMSLGEEEREASRELAAKLSLRILSRNWQMLLKGLSEVEISARPLAAAEMLLIRLCHAADLPNLEDALQLLEQHKPQNGAPPVFINLQTAAAIAGDTRQEKTAKKDNAQSVSIVPEAVADTADNAPKTIAPPAAAQNHANSASSPAMNVTEQKQQAETTGGMPAQSARSLPETQKEQPQSAPAASAFLQELAETAKEQRNETLSFILRENIRPVSLLQTQTADGVQNVFQFEPLPNAPKDIERQINTVLKTAGKRDIWAQAVASGGGETLKELLERQQRDLTENIQQNENIKAVLRHFPDAKLVDVREQKQTGERQAATAAARSRNA